MFLYGAWRNCFLAAATLPLLLIAPTLFAHGNGDTSVGRRADSAGRVGLSFWLCVAGFALIAGSEIGVALWLPAYGREVRGFSARQANLLLSVFLSGMVAGRFTCSALSRSLTARRSIAYAGAALVFVIPALLSSGYGAACASFFLFGLAFSATWPSYFAYLSHVFPDHVGLMSGAAILSTQLGFATCSYVTGKLAVANLSYPIIFGAVVMGIFVAAYFILSGGKQSAAGGIS